MHEIRCELDHHYSFPYLHMLAIILHFLLFHNLWKLVENYYIAIVMVKIFQLIGYWQVLHKI